MEKVRHLLFCSQRDAFMSRILSFLCRRRKSSKSCCMGTRIYACMHVSKQRSSEPCCKDNQHLFMVSLFSQKLRLSLMYEANILMCKTHTHLSGGRCHNRRGAYLAFSRHGLIWSKARHFWVLLCVCGEEPRSCVRGSKSGQVRARPELVRIYVCVMCIHKDVCR